jgi:polysaccharide export outer membrane protein
VAKPSVFNIPNARISLLEAIGMAGDMTIYGRRDNVLLIREENKKKITVRINLNSSDLFQSPYYYLKSNDVVYVEPNNSKVSGASKSREIIPIVFSALSFLVIGVDILRR